MIYFCADDYGLCDIASMHIKECIDEDTLNKVSVFPNFDRVDLNEILKDRETKVSLHLNLVEGKCMSDARKIDLIVDSEGNFRYTFVKLFIFSLFKRKKFEAQVYNEIRAQVLFWKSILPIGASFLIDSHQHTHMIPAVFKALIKVLNDEKIELEYLRIPAEPILPYIKSPSLYLTYSAVNVIKQWLLKIWWLFNKREAETYNIPTAYFFGILFSGKMDEKRVNKVLPKYIKMAEKNNRDLEVLLHPGYIQKDEYDFENLELTFLDFYKSENRKIEFDTLMKTSIERSVK